MASAVHVTESSRASFLGLPLELRNLIYQEVLLLDLQWIAVDHWIEAGLRYARFHCFPSLGRNPSIPWINLAATCKAVHEDLCGMRSEVSTLRNTDNTTYVLDFELDRDSRVTWRSLPCSPVDATCLTANIFFCQDYNYAFFEKQNPLPVLRHMYQTLNRVIHCGPRLDEHKPLQRAMHFDEVLVRLHGYKEGDDRDPKPRKTPFNWRHTRRGKRCESPLPFTPIFPSMSSHTSLVVQHGIAFQAVDRFTLIEEEEDDAMAIWTVDEVENGGVPQRWRRYGFDWGDRYIRVQTRLERKRKRMENDNKDSL